MKILKIFCKITMWFLTKLEPILIQILTTFNSNSMKFLKIFCKIAMWFLKKFETILTQFF